MGSSPWAKALGFGLCLLGTLAFLLYIAPIKAC